MLIPSRQGMKINAAGHTRAMDTQSWYARLTIRIDGSPASAQAASIAASWSYTTYRGS